MTKEPRESASLPEGEDVPGRSAQAASLPIAEEPSAFAVAPVATATAEGDRRILEAAILPTLLRLAGPAILSMFLYTALNLIDAFWVGRLGSVPLAAVMTSLFAIWILNSFADLVAVGATALVSRQVGAGRVRRAGEIGFEALVLAIVVSLPFLAAGSLGARAIFRWIGVDPDVARLGSAYLTICSAASPVIFVSLLLEAVARASGDTRRPMNILSITLGINALLAPCFIMGWGPFPAWGVKGAAVATVIAQVIGLVLFWRLFTGTKPPLRLVRVPLRSLRISSMTRIALIGLPTTLNGILFSFVYLWFGSIAARFGTGPLAALGLGNRIESLAYLTAYGFSVATATMVGQNLGAGRPERAEKSAWTAVGLIFGFVTLYAAALVLFRGPIFEAFSHDGSVIAAGKRFLPVLAICIPFVGPEVVIAGAFGGAGNTLPPTVISLPLSLLRIPLAWILSLKLGWGPDGIWWTITITCIVRTLILVGWFRKNRWKNAGLAAAALKKEAST